MRNTSWRGLLATLLVLSSCGREGPFRMLFSPAGVEPSHATVALEGEGDAPVVVRLGAADCPEGLSPGDRVMVRFTMGVMVRVAREVAS